MKSQHPTSQEIDELVAFLPRLYAEGVTPIDRWGGGTSDQDGVITIQSWPEYNPIVREFFDVASSECWTDYECRPEEGNRMLHDDNVIKNASVAQIRTMLTFCVRGERFCDGHWAGMIQRGHIRRLLERLCELRSADTQPDAAKQPR